MPLFECLLKHRPVSVQSKGKTKWKERVFDLFSKERNGIPLITMQIRLSLVYLCNDDCTTDIDNIVKPIQDALIGSVIEEDYQVIDRAVTRTDRLRLTLKSGGGAAIQIKAT